MSEWVRIRLGDALTELIDHRGKTPTKLGGEWESAGVRVISAINIKERRLDNDNLRYVSRSTYERWMPVPLKAGDVLLTSEAPLGELAYLAEELEACLGQRLFGLRARPEVLIGRYLFYLLGWGDARDQLLSRATGSTVSGIRQSELVKIELNLPSVTEQRAISGVLGALDDAIEANRRAVGVAEELADLLFVHISEGWPERTLADLAAAGSLSFSDGYRTRSDQLGKPGVPILRVADLADGHYTLDPDADHVSEEFLARAALKCSSPGDVVVSTKGTVGRTAMVRRGDPPMVYSPQICFLRTSKGGPFSPSLLHRWARVGFKGQAANVQSQTDMAPYVNLGDLGRMMVPVPPGEAHVGLTELEDLDELASARRRQSAHLRALRDAVLPELLSGRLQVREAERVGEGVV